MYTVCICVYIYICITVASMLLISPCVRLDCVSSASKTRLDYVWSVNVFMLSVWAILPAKFPSFFGWSCWFVAHLNKIAQQTAEWRSSLHVLVCVSVQIWGPGLHFGAWFGSNFGPCFGFHFWAPLILFVIVRAQNGAQKWSPKQGPKYDPNQDPKISKFVLRRKQGPTWSSFSGLVSERIQVCNKLTTSTKEGRETWAGKIAQTESMNTFTDQT